MGIISLKTRYLQNTKYLIYSMPRPLDVDFERRSIVILLDSGNVLKASREQQIAMNVFLMTNLIKTKESK